MASATDQSTDFKATDFKDHQETMFEDPTSFAIPEEETSQEVPDSLDESLDESPDSLPTEEPDTVHNQILFPEHSSDTDSVPDTDPPPVLVGAHQGTNPLPRAQFASGPMAPEAPVMAGQEFMPPPPPVPDAVAQQEPAAQVQPPPEAVSEKSVEKFAYNPAEQSPAPEAVPETVHETVPDAVLSMNDFAALEERVLRAVSLVRREREARHAAEERLMHLESQALAQAPVVEQLQQEVDALRAERDQVRQRVERLLGQLDALEL